MGRVKIEMRSGKATSLADQRSRVLGMLQSEMARKLKCSQTTISFVESGELVPPDIKTWAREYSFSTKRFAQLHELNCQLPLWKFARKESKSESKSNQKLA